MAGIIRLAVDGHLHEQADARAALVATFGSAPNLEVPSRDEWARG